jgi:hypothetical protein
MATKSADALKEQQQRGADEMENQCALKNKQ